MPLHLKPAGMLSSFQGIANRFISKHDEFSTAKKSDALFPRTNPSVDGDDCLHDCESCTIKYPSKFSVDETDKLYGLVNGWSRHILVATGKTDWVRDVEDETGSVMEAVGKYKGDVNSGKLMLSASNIPVPDHHEFEGPYGPDRPTRILLLPSFQWVDGVTPNLVPELINTVINTASTNTQPLFKQPSQTPVDSITNGTLTSSELHTDLKIQSCPHKYLVLLCSQATRDARCGQSAPLLRKELERHLRPLGLYRDLSDERPGGVGIYFISHVGGHKYSANVMIYRKADRKNGVSGQQLDGAVEHLNGNGTHKQDTTPSEEAGQCIWLARVRPEDCENIVKYTILQGKVVKPDRQLRGGFDREKGIVSW